MTDAVFCLMVLFLAWLILRIEVLLSYPLSLSFCPLPLTFFFIYCDLTKPAILFFIEFRRLHYCIIASDRESMAVDVSLSFITDAQPSALFSVGV